MSEHYVVTIDIKKIVKETKQVRNLVGGGVTSEVNRIVDDVTHIVQKAGDLEGAVIAVKKHMDVILGTETLDDEG